MRTYGLLREFNKCHTPGGSPIGGQFCAAPDTGSGGGSTAADDYRGQHTAPGPENAPAYDLSGTYPDDVYGPNAVQYYGHGGDNARMDQTTIALVQSLKGRPNAPVTIYRAVPVESTRAEEIAELELTQKNILRRGSADPWEYDRNAKTLDRLRALPPTPPRPVKTIRPGDWVTVNRQYAREHGESTLLGKYVILSKKVKAKEIFTNGDSIHEWGYHPGGKVAEAYGLLREFNKCHDQQDGQFCSDGAAGVYPLADHTVAVAKSHQEAPHQTGASKPKPRPKPKDK